MRAEALPYNVLQISAANKPALDGGNPVRKNLLSFSPPDIQEEEITAVNRVLRSGWITTGALCREFEEGLASYTGAKHAVALSSATAGLFLSLKISGIGEGDEVVTTPYTFAATANSILHTGAKPVFADIEEGSFNISPEEIEKKITRKTKAIIPVHFAGHPVRLKEIYETAERNHLIVIEDAAHAIGASYKEKKIGSGEYPAVFSFHAVKNLTTAEGGAVLTGYDHIARKLRLYSLHGQTRDAFSKLLKGGWKYDITVPGYKFNMTDIQAALGISQLGRIDNNRKKRQQIAARYTSFLKDFEFVKTPDAEKGVTHAWHLYPILIDFSQLTIGRDAFITALSAENISSNVHFIPVHIMSYYSMTFGYEPYDFPVSYTTYLQEVSLPIYPQMGTNDADDVIEALSKLFTHYKK